MGSLPYSTLSRPYIIAYAIQKPDSALTKTISYTRSNHAKCITYFEIAVGHKFWKKKKEKKFFDMHFMHFFPFCDKYVSYAILFSFFATIITWVSIEQNVFDFIVTTFTFFVQLDGLSWLKYYQSQYEAIHVVMRGLFL